MIEEGRMAVQAPADEVDHFLTSTEFSGYQAVLLPHGRRVPGRDRMKTAEVVFRDGVVGKSVLDVGTYYGFFPLEAIRRGAASAVGIEMDRSRYEIARRIAELNGGRYEIVLARAEDYEPGRRFDVVLALNLLHHVLDPIGFVSRLADLCSGTLIVEFRLPVDPGYIEYVLSKGRHLRIWHRLLASVRSRLLQVAGVRLPLMAVGNRPYHRVFYLSPEAFRNLFVIHLKKFRHVEFARSPGRGRRVVAFCQVAG
jgi:SAM-dependent methyltransferase